MMDLPKVLRELRQQLELIERAIAALERLQRTVAPRRGRPPKILEDIKQTSPPKKRGGRRLSHDVIDVKSAKPATALAAGAEGNPQE